MVNPTRRRDAVNYLTKRHRVSERRACKVVDQHRSTQRYQRTAPDFEQELVKRMNQLAERHPRYGYRRIRALLRSEGFEVNKKRIERLWRLEGHRVPPPRKTRQKANRGSGMSSAWELRSNGPGDIWSLNFVHTRTSSGAAIRILNVVDEFTRVALGSRVAPAIGTRDVISHLGGLLETHKAPRILRSDNGREFTSELLGDWLKARGISQAFIEPGTPQQNTIVERFNGTMRTDTTTATPTP